MREGPVIDAVLAEDLPALAVRYATSEVGGRACAVATLETGVPAWPIDDERALWTPAALTGPRA